jgi:ribosomal protein S6--L-glutamate ligase
MCDALRRVGIDAFVFALSDCVHDLNNGRVMLAQRDLSDLDGIVVKKLGEHPSATSRLRLHHLRQLEAHGVRIFSRPSSIDAAMDRYRMSMRLASSGLPTPKTFAVEGGASLAATVRDLGNAVMKPIYTSKARGMAKLNSGSIEPVEGAADGVMLVQEFVESRGRDIGACILGGSFIGAFYRVAAAGQWITSTSAGGTYASCKLPPEGVDLALNAADVFGLDYTVVDLVEAGRGFSIYEVSAFGGFRGLWEASGYDVAADYARYVKWELQL